MDPIDRGLTRLRATGAGSSLDGLEMDVLARLKREPDGPRGSQLPLQVAASCTALFIGLLVAQLLAPASPGLHSETVVLSEDLAPSVRLEGGGA